MPDTAATTARLVLNSCGVLSPRVLRVSIAAWAMLSTLFFASSKMAVSAVMAYLRTCPHSHWLEMTGPNSPAKLA